MINVLGDALAAGIIAHLCRKDFPLSATGKVKTPEAAQSHTHTPVWIRDGGQVLGVKRSKQIPSNFRASTFGF